MEGSVQRRQKPKIRLYIPIWYHPHGSKMCVESLDQQNRILIISGSAAKVTIRRTSSVYPDIKKDWFVDWEVVQCALYKEGTRGRTRFNDEDLAAAFGLSDNSGKLGDWLIEQFGADSAKPGGYIRWEEFLNIPCPGTGQDGDPNVSIRLDEEIRNAVQQLLA